LFPCGLDEFTHMFASVGLVGDGEWDGGRNGQLAKEDHTHIPRS
jgi:hypothetical protein